MPFSGNLSKKLSVIFNLRSLHVSTLFASIFGQKYVYSAVNCHPATNETIVQVMDEANDLFPLRHMDMFVTDARLS